MRICLNLDILYMGRTRIQKEVAMLELLLVASWLSLALYSTWFFTQVKQYAALSPREVYLLWSIHKSETGCNALSYLYKIQKKKGFVGFKCLCGYEYVSKRSIV